MQGIQQSPFFRYFAHPYTQVHTFPDLFSLLLCPFRSLHASLVSFSLRAFVRCFGNVHPFPLFVYELGTQSPNKPLPEFISFLPHAIYVEYSSYISLTTPHPPKQQAARPTLHFALHRIGHMRETVYAPPPPLFPLRFTRGRLPLCALPPTTTFQRKAATTPPSSIPA